MAWQRPFSLAGKLPVGIGFWGGLLSGDVLGGSLGPLLSALPLLFLLPLFVQLLLPFLEAIVSLGHWDTP
jgi:hypothetical protein